MNLVSQIRFWLSFPFFISLHPLLLHQKFLHLSHSHYYHLNFFNTLFPPIEQTIQLKKKILICLHWNIYSYVCCKIKTKFLSNGGFTRAIERSRRNIIGAKDFLHNNQTIIHTYACPRPTNLLFNLKTTFSSFDFFFLLPFFHSVVHLCSFKRIVLLKEKEREIRKLFGRKITLTIVWVCLSSSILSQEK